MTRKKKRTTKTEDGTPACHKCGLPIAFRKLENGKYCPTNPDGSDHWDLCSATRRAGRPWDPARDEATSGRFVGSKFVEHDCRCIPWESCSCGKSPT